VVRKFFPLDKNYLLEEAQLSLRAALLGSLVESVKREYELRHNPLGVCDEWILKIRSYEPQNLEPLENFYQNLAGIYRYKFGETQLAFLWNGNEHSEKYKADWTNFFNKQVHLFCRSELFIRAVLDLTVFNNYSQLAENRMNNFMLEVFEVKLNKQRGIVDVKVA
jgi:hypothetical protein